MGQQLRDHMAGGRQLSAVVIAQIPVRDPGNQGIHDHIARPCIKGGDLFQGTPGGKQRHVANAADVLQGHVLGLAAVKQEFRIRHQGRTQPPCRHIPDAEIADHRAAEFLGQIGWVTDLQGAPDDAA